MDGQRSRKVKSGTEIKFDFWFDASPAPIRSDLGVFN